MQWNLGASLLDDDGNKRVETMQILQHQRDIQMQSTKPILMHMEDAKHDAAGVMRPKKPENWEEMSDEEKEDWKKSEEQWKEEQKQMREQQKEEWKETKEEWKQDWEEQKEEWKTDNSGPGKPMMFRMQPNGMPMHDMKPELPEDWEDMDEDEQEAWKEDHPKPKTLQLLKREDLPENWEEMSDDEKETWRKENLPDPRKFLMIEDLPADWAQMPGEDRREYAEENDLDLPPHMQFRLLHNPRQAMKYHGFSGEMKPKKEFSDGAKIHRKAAVEFLQERGILDGNDDGSFNPQGPINRGETMKVILEALGEDVSDESDDGEFKDVPQGAWFAPYVNRGRKLGIVKGYEDGSFQPGKTVQQVELLKIAFESFGIDLSGYDVSNLPDGVDPNSWFAPYLQYAIDNELIDPENVNPGVGMSREEFSEVIYRLIQQQENLEE